MQYLKLNNIGVDSFSMAIHFYACKIIISMKYDQITFISLIYFVKCIKICWPNLIGNCCHHFLYTYIVVTIFSIIRLWRRFQEIKVWRHGEAFWCNNKSEDRDLHLHILLHNYFWLCKMLCNPNMHSQSYIVRSRHRSTSSLVLSLINNVTIYHILLLL